MVSQYRNVCGSRGSVRVCSRSLIPGMLMYAELHHVAEEAHIKSMSTAKPVSSIAELLALPEDGMRHELLRGLHVVTPSPRFDHQRIVTALMLQMGPVVESKGNLTLMTSPADIHLGEDTLVQPDLFVIEDRIVGDWTDAPKPLLVIEILSPATAARDRGIKRQIYMDAGIAEYWIVDIEGRCVERWRSGDARPEIVFDNLEWRVEAVSGRVDLERLFGSLTP